MIKKAIKGILLTFLSFIALVMPLAILMFLKRNEWFAFEVDGTKVSVGFIIALVFALCLLKGAFKDLDPRFTTIFVLGIMSVITWLLESIIKDLTLILICSIVGYVLYVILNSFGKASIEFAKEYRKEKARMSARTEEKELDGSV